MAGGCYDLELDTKVPSGQIYYTYVPFPLSEISILKNKNPFYLIDARSAERRETVGDKYPASSYGFHTSIEQPFTLLFIAN